MQSWNGRDLKAPFVPTPCHRQGCHPSKGIFPPDAEAQGATSHPSVFPESSSPSLCSCSIPWVMPKGITGHRHAAAHAAGSIWAMTDAINSMLVKVCLEGDAFPTAINVIQQLTLPGLLCWCSATSPAWEWGGWPPPAPKLVTPRPSFSAGLGTDRPRKEKVIPAFLARSLAARGAFQWQGGTHRVSRSDSSQQRGSRRGTGAQRPRTPGPPPRIDICSVQLWVTPPKTRCTPQKSRTPGSAAPAAAGPGCSARGMRGQRGSRAGEHPCPAEPPQSSGRASRAPAPRGIPAEPP